MCARRPDLITLRLRSAPSYRPRGARAASSSSNRGTPDCSCCAMRSCDAAPSHFVFLQLVFTPEPLPKSTAESSHATCTAAPEMVLPSCSAAASVLSSSVTSEAACRPPTAVTMRGCGTRASSARQRVSSARPGKLGWRDRKGDRSSGALHPLSYAVEPHQAEPAWSFGYLRRPDRRFRHGRRDQVDGLGSDTDRQSAETTRRTSKTSAALCG